MVASAETRRKISESNKGKVCSQDTRNKIRDALSGKIRKRGRESPNYGRKASELARLNMSNAQSKERHRLYGKHHSEETIAKIRRSESIPTVQLDTYGNLIKRWDSMADAKLFGFCDSKISNCCKNKRLSHCGYIWMMENDYNNITLNDLLEKCKTIREIKNKYTSIRIIQLAKDKTFIKEWSSVSEVSKYGFNKGCVSNCCIGRAKTHQGYLWLYAKDYYIKEKETEDE